MKNFILLLIFLFCVNTAAISADNSTATLEKLENAVIGAPYTGQKTETRLERLEKIIYGKTNKGKPHARLNKLAKDLNADVIGQEITPCEDTIGNNYEEIADSSVDYPVITAVEKDLKIKSLPNQSLHSRLVSIEKQLFNNVYDTDDFYTRVERIKGKVYKNSNIIAESYDDDDIYIKESNSDDTDEWNLDKILNRKSNTGVRSKLSKLEKKVFDMSYANQNTNDRLTRLEREIFNTEFYDDNERDRLDRLEGAIKGQKTASKYDSNKFQQRLNTAMQIGAMILMVLACIL